MTAAFPRGNILLVDDTPNNLRLLSAMLTEQGYEVRRVIDGQMALKTAQANPPDLILLDIRMPNMSGYEVCQHLKAIATTRDIPVIFISALDEVLDKVKAFAVGGIDYITKPFSEEEVFARVENALTIRHLQQQLQEQQHHLTHAQQHAEQLAVRLQQSETRWRHFFHNTLIGSFRVDREGRLLEVNARLLTLLDYDSTSELMAAAAWSWLQSQSREHLLTLLLTDGEIHSYSARLIRRDGSEQAGLISAYWNAEEGCIDGVVLFPEGNESTNR